jgi:hypothetical protein
MKKNLNLNKKKLSVKDKLREITKVSEGENMSIEDVENFVIKSATDIKIWRDRSVDQTTYVEIEHEGKKTIAKLDDLRSIEENLDNSDQFRETIEKIIN